MLTSRLREGTRLGGLRNLGGRRSALYTIASVDGSCIDSMKSDV